MWLHNATRLVQLSQLFWVTNSRYIVVVSTWDLAVTNGKRRQQVRQARVAAWFEEENEEATGLLPLLAGRSKAGRPAGRKGACTEGTGAALCRGARG